MQLQTEAREQETPFLLTIDEAIKATRTSRATLYREINSGRLKTVSVGRRRYVTPAAIQNWINGLEGRAA